jgi:hypothetical protein
MTLIAAWRCQDGIVVHADSQETVPLWTGVDWVEYRKSVQKIAPKKMGAFQVLVAGSGNPGLIESFIVCIERKLISEPDKTSLQDFVSLTESELLRFRDVDVRACQDSDKTMDLVIGAVSTATGQYEAWTNKNMRLKPISRERPELVGWYQALYDDIAARLYTPDKPIAQLILSGVYMFTIAENTSNCIKGPISVAVIRENGIFMENVKYIRQIRDRIDDYEPWINNIFLACADTSIHAYKLKELLEEFSAAAVSLHQSQIDKTVGDLTLEEIAKTDDPYPKLPLGSVITTLGDGTMKFEHDPEMLIKKLQQFRQITESLPAAPRYAKCINCGSEVEYKLVSPKENLEPGSFNCPECNAVIRSIGKVSAFRKIGTTAWKKG